MSKLDKLRYPIGSFEYGKNYSIEDTQKNIKTIEKFPKELKKLLKKLSNQSLDVS